MDSPDYTTSDSTVESENQSDSSWSGSSLFKTQCVLSSPTWRQRNQTQKCIYSPKNIKEDSSSDSSFEPKPLTLKAIFERFKKRKWKKRKYKPTGRPKGRPKGSKNTRRSQIDKKQVRGKGHKFTESENRRNPLPWRKILTFEQAVARGFFNYIEKLKYEHHLKESLNKMNVGEDLEKEDLDSHRYKYLDDDGSISPIEEPVTDEAMNLEPDDECDIKLVEDSCFIISSEFPVSKKMDVYLGQENTKEPVLSKKRASKAKNTGQKTE
ncbi:TATA box-binding protein-associated factor RNA polymerase I subunit D-like isoform X1 [Tupaia chinensis]|uniref:TATA box-binding protein-associated factor RNA polymerase I subunit D-like isoform X1 n=1 Tax=Tupaia chinensis TaxID=246437 RepID=UPI000FFC7A6D|nr:TATA box-binding protein-associated factor RNA polymerase I subunit D-like isoform X1 [Tupaia chinensis]